MVENLDDVWRNARNNYMEAIEKARKICEAAVELLNSEEQMEPAFKAFEAAVWAATIELKRQYGYN